jgi:hypothetical protein
MAIVCRVYGATNKTQRDLSELADRLRLLLEDECRELELLSGRKVKTQRVSVFFPSDLMEYGAGRGVALFIDGFPFKGVVYMNIVDRISRGAALLLKQYFPNDSSISVVDGYQTDAQA